MKRLIILVFFTCSVLLNPLFATTNVLKVIDVTYRTASSLLPSLKPLLSEDETISADGQKLIISASAETLSKLTTVISQLDIAPIVFEVSIHQGAPDWQYQEDSEAETWSTNSQANAGDSQSVKVNNGDSAFVSIGGERPVVSSVGVGWNTGVSYERDQTTEGFYITPSLQGKKVKLVLKRIRQRQDQVNQQQDQNGYLDTTITVALDKWTKIGSGAEISSGANQDNVSYSSEGSFTDTSTLFVKVKSVH